ncbi:MAG: hypothetical protein KJ941_11045 [Bacteroidetes bacterium]|nr:hypothetical protein [Bacteroidota bacterium]
MKSIPQKRTLLGVVFLLAFVWIVLLLYKTLWLSHNTTVFEKIPSNANVVFRVNGSKIIRTGAFTVLMEARDPMLIQVINEAIQNKREYSGPSQNIGVDWLNDFAVFTLEEEGRYLMGISAHLKSERLLYKNAKNYFDSYSSYATNGEHIVILKNLNQNSPLSKKTLNNIASKILTIKNVGARRLSDSSEDNAFVLTTEAGYLGESSVFCKSAIYFKEHMNGFKVKGDLTLNPKNKDLIVETPMLTPKGFHFQTRIIPLPAQKKIQSLLTDNGLNFPKIDAIGLNYFGCNIENTQKGLKVSPAMELLIHFKEKTDLFAHLQKSPIVADWGWKLENSELTNGVITYTIKNIDSNSYLVFQKDHEPKLSALNPTLFKLSGMPKSLLDLDGDPFIIGFIKMFQLYKTSLELFDQSEFVELKIQKINADKAYIEGQYRFKNNVYPLNEILKYTISNGWTNLD